MARDEAYWQFENFLRANCEPGSRSPFPFPLDSSSSPVYYPDDCLQRFLEFRAGSGDTRRDKGTRALKTLLQAVLDRSSHSLPSLDDRLLLRDSPRVFSILLSLKRGHAILNFIGKPHFSDKNLPFDNRDAFIELTHDEKFCDEFFQRQWSFCAPKLDGFSGMVWEPERILPFQVLEQLGQGANRTYLIQVDRDYNELAKGRQSNAEVSYNALRVIAC
jgi:hypothetical protein